MKLGAFIIVALAGSVPLRLPTPLLHELRTRTLGEACTLGSWTQPSPLGSETHVSLSDGGLLVFLQVPDEQCARSNKAVPVVVDPRGRFSWGHSIEGVVTSVSVAPDGVLWAASQVQTEEARPMLWTSADGLHWEQVELPVHRTTRGPQEKLVALCPTESGLCVELEEASDHAIIHALLWRDLAPPSAWGTAATCAPCEHRGTTTWGRQVAEGSAAVVFESGTLSVAFPSMLWHR